MRIVMLGAKGLPGVQGGGGVERGVREIADRLVALGHEVIVYERARSFGTRIEAGIIVRSVPFVDRKALAGWSHIALSLLDSLARLRGVTVYHVHSASNGFFCLPLRLFTGARVIFHLHGAEWRVRKWGTLMATLFRASCVLGGIAAHEVASVCMSGVRAMNSLPGVRRKTQLIPNGVPRPPDDHSCGQTVAGAAGSAPPFILYAGRLVPHKRIDLLIEAFRQVDSNAQLLIAGPGSYCDAYVASLKDLALGDSRIVFAGLVDFATMNILYRRCLAVVLPSEAEGCSNVLLEALGFGCCIVTSDKAENLAVVGGAAAVFKSGDSSALVRTLNRVMCDRAEVIRLRRAARIRSREMADWDAVTRSFLQLYAGELTSPTLVVQTPAIRARSESLQ
jgi:glycosyltransferase involved in cell wall biosynthesis